MKNNTSGIIKLLILGGLLALSFSGFSQILVENPVFTEDFGTVPDDWKNRGNDYSSGDISTYREPVRRGNAHYPWAKRRKEFLIGWVDKSLNDFYGNGKYAIGCNGKKLGDSGTWHAGVDHTGNTNGLALVVNGEAKKNTLVYDFTIDAASTSNHQDLQTNGVYQFKVYVANVEAGGTLSSVPNVAIELNNGEAPPLNEATGDIKGNGDKIPWMEHIMYAEVKANKNLKYSVISVNGGLTANIFAVDDISLSPVKIRADQVNVDFCSQPSQIGFEAVVPDIPEKLKVYTRLLKRAKAGGEWQWEGEVSDSLKVYTLQADYPQYDYRVVVSLSEAYLNGSTPEEHCTLNAYDTYSVTENFVPVYTCEAWSDFPIRIDFCTQPDSVFFKTEETDFPVTADVYFRLMRRPLHSEAAWEWYGETTATYQVGAPALNFLSYEYQVATAVASPELLNRRTPAELMDYPNYGCYAIKNAFQNDFCLQLFGVTLDYTTVQDSVKVTPSLVAPDGTTIYVRWMCRPFGATEWSWQGEAVDSAQNKIDWVSFANGDFRAVYGVSAEMLNAISCENIQERDYFYVATKENAIHGIALDMLVSKRFESGAAWLEAEPADRVSPEARAAIKGKWMVRKKGTEEWEWLPARNGFQQQIGIVNYVQHEYRFVASMAQTVLDTLQLAGDLTTTSAYWLSEIIGGETFVVGEITRDYCETPGKVKWNVDFQSQGIPEEMPVIGRWMKQNKISGNWEWMTENFPDRIALLEASMADYLAHNYRLVLCWSHDSLAGWEAGTLPVDRDYYVVQDTFTDVALCVQADTILIRSFHRDELVLQPQWRTTAEKLTVYGRWMRQSKADETWEWVSETPLTANYDLTVTTADFEHYDYRFYAGVAPEIFETEASLAQEEPYWSSRELKGNPVYKPEIEQPEITCIARQDSNKVVLSIRNHEKIKTLNYRLGTGENRHILTTGSEKLQFTIGRDSVFYLLSYSLEGICDSIVRNDTVKLPYIPKLQITRFTDVFGCKNTKVVLKPEAIGGKEVNYEWFRGEEELWAGQGDTLAVVFEEPGTVPLKLKVSGEDVCPEDSTVFAITGQYPEIIYQPQAEPEELCVGQYFTIPYDSLEADQYRISLKETTLPNFVFYPGSGNAETTGSGELVLKSLQTPLVATDFMAGHEFTFRIQIFRLVEYRGVNYRCENEFEYRFRIRPVPSSRYPSLLKLCIGENIVLSPEVNPNENTISLYRWRLWDGALLQEQELKRSEADLTLEQAVEAAWNGKRLQLLAQCECGEVPVQDIALAVYVPDSNWVKAPEGIVVAGEKTELTGSVVNLKETGYRWERKIGESEWELLEGEKGNSISLYAPDTTAVYRRTIAGEGWSCPDMTAAPVKIEVYNNELENHIYLAPEDTLIYAGTTIVVHTTYPGRKGVTYGWERYETGTWIEMTGENQAELTCMPASITKYRRVVRVGNSLLYSNEVIVNVYSADDNKIMAAASILSPGEPGRILGNYVDVPGVRYRWFADQGEGWYPVEGQTGWNLELPVTQQTRFVRYVYLPSQPGDSVISNEVTLYVFDNTRDNRIECTELNVCRDEQLLVKGREIAGEGIAYRWETSIDSGQSWMVLDGQHSANLSLTIEKDVWVRRRILYDEDSVYYSNILQIHAVYNEEDNVIEIPEVIIAGEPGMITGTLVPNASYRWEKSEDGEGWQVIAGKEQQHLELSSAETQRIYYLRRKLQFPDGAGCEAYSNVLKMVALDKEKSNTITGTGGYVCEWTPFTLEGTDMSDLRASYQWYKEEEGAWVPVYQAFGKDLTVYEGIGKALNYRRQATVEGMAYESNVVQVELWKGDLVNNTLEQPGIACAGQTVEIKGSDVYQGGVDLAGYVKSYAWERSTTGAGNTWEPIDSAATQNLWLENVEEPRWICRIVNTSCGTALRSKPVLLEVKEKLRLTLRNDAPFGMLSPKTPIKISIDEDFYTTYEIQIDGRTQAIQDKEYLFYGWAPKREYQVIANGITSLGCVQTDTMWMRTPDVDLPNVLTPNEDGYNDILLKGYDLKVYNRWGNLLYSGKDGWNARYKGRIVSPGTYFYVVKIEHIDGSLSEYKKSVTIKK